MLWSDEAVDSGGGAYIQEQQVNTVVPLATETKLFDIQTVVTLQAEVTQIGRWFVKMWPKSGY